MYFLYELHAGTQVMTAALPAGMRSTEAAARSD